jgi:hypothetical protein
VNTTPSALRSALGAGQGGKVFPPELVLRPFELRVQGFSPQIYFAASRGKALRDAWYAYSGALGHISFGDFLRVAKAWRVPPPARFGEAIRIAGQPAFYVSERMQYVSFVRPGSDRIFLSHPADVEVVA